MNVYDFDDTIYNGNCTVDFYKFCLKRQPGLLRYLLVAAMTGVKYLLGFADKTQIKERFFVFLRGVDDVDTVLDQFWGAYIGRVQDWYLRQQLPDDVVISASPFFLVEPACRRIGVAHVIASPVDRHSGRYSGRNCDGVEKVRQFKRQFPGQAVDNFYSDSNDDLPMARLAGRAYKVAGGVPGVWDLEGR